MDHRASLLRLLLLLLVFSTVFSRNLKAVSWEEGTVSSAQDLHEQGLTEGVSEEKEPSFVIEGRMGVERVDVDYSRPGANNHHDPKPPGSF